MGTWALLAKRSGPGKPSDISTARFWGLSFADSCNSHHSSGLSFFSAVGEKQFRMATRAQIRRLDILLRYSSSEQLLTICVNQVEEDFGWQFAMPRGAGCEEQQWIFLAHRIGFLHLAKQAGAVSELRL